MCGGSCKANAVDSPPHMAMQCVPPKKPSRNRVNRVTRGMGWRVREKGGILLVLWFSGCLSDAKKAVGWIANCLGCRQ